MEDRMLLWMLLVPAIAGAVAFLWPRRSSVTVHLLMLIVAGWLLWQTIRLQSDMGIHWDWTWLEFGTRAGAAAIAIDLWVTTFSAIIALLIAIFGVLISFYCLGFTDRQAGKHNAYMLWTLAGALGAALANNLIFLLFCWEVVTLMLFLLVNLGGEQAKAGAAKSFAVLGFSDCAMLLGIVLLLSFGEQPTLRMNELSITINSGLTRVCFLLFAAAAFAKAGAMPLHTWIPAAAEGAPTDVMAFLPACLDKLLGIYLLARVSLEFFVLTEGLKILLMIVGAVTIVGAVMMAMIQHDLKKLLSFHAVSQVGYMVLGIGTGTWIGVAGALFHMINNAIYKNCLFLTAGSVEKRIGTTDLDKLGGLARAMPLTFLAGVISALAISGVPPLNGFTSKLMIYQASLDATSWTGIAPFLVAAAVFGSALTLASFVKVIHSVFLGAPTPAIVRQRPRENSLLMTGPMLILAGASLAAGIFAMFTVGWLVAPGMEQLSAVRQVPVNLAQEGVTASNILWNPTWAVILLAAAFVFGLLIFYLGKGIKIRPDRIYLGGERLCAEDFHYSGTGFYGTVRELPGLKGLVNDAERKVLDPYHILGRMGGSLVELLGSAQTGVLSLYVSWVILGLVIIMVYLLANLPG